MISMFVISIVALGTMAVLNAVGAAIASDDEISPFLILNFFVMAFAVVALSLGLAR